MTNMIRAPGCLCWMAFSKKNPLHLLIGGHVHHYFRIDPFSGECTTKKKTALMKNTPVLPFTVVANDTDTAVFVKASPDSLKMRVVNADGKQVDEFSILPDARPAGTEKPERKRRNPVQ